MSFEVAVVEFPAKYLVGMKVRTSMQKAKTDCPAIWQTFGPRIIEISLKDCSCTEAFGLSIMASESDFDYWAAVEAKPEINIPNGMGTVAIPGGLYAKCAVADLSELGEAFMFVYSAWIQGQSEYVLDMTAPCFEFYPQNWRLEDALDTYVPVVRK